MLIFITENKKELFYEQIFKTLQEYLGHRFNRPFAGMTADFVEELIAVQGLDHEIAEKLRDCFLQCDMARYAAATLNKDNMQDILVKLEQSIDYLERYKQWIWNPGLVLSLFS